MRIKYTLNMSINVKQENGKRTWVKKIYETENLQLNSLEALREYLYDKRKAAVDMIPQVEEEVKKEYKLPKKFKVVSTYPRVITSPKNRSNEMEDMEFLISFKVVTPNGVVASI